jgi:hypothetical protein
MASEAARERRGVAVVESAEPPAANEDTKALAESADPAANIYKRLWRIEQELEAVEKSQTATVKIEGGGSYSYKYSGHDLILSFVRPLLAKHGVKVWPTTTKHERIGNLTALTVRLDFVNVDDPKDTTSAEVVNYGADKGDKGASKALTNAMREGIKKALNITSEEDKKADEHTDFEPAEGASRAEVDAAKERAADSVVGWASTFKAALQGCRTKKEVGRLQAENAARLTAPELPAVTREFFNDLIAKLKAELPETAA